ncbi:MAG: Hsp20/alpha crystallin family protein [Salinivirgaceae bacterium]
MRTRSTMPTIVDHFFNNRLMDNLWVENLASFSPSVNITEDEIGYAIELAYPGIEKTDFQITTEKDRLIISYEHKSEQEENNEEKKYLRREFSSTSFKKSFSLPENAETENISAEYKNGVLNVVIPKAAEKAKLSKQISIS